MREVIDKGEGWRVADRRYFTKLDEDEKTYDVLEGFLEEFVFFPFAPYDDFLDATSRIYDMDPIGPVYYEGSDGADAESELPSGFTAPGFNRPINPAELEPEVFEDGI